MTPVVTPIDAATYTTRVPYITNAEFTNSPTGVDVLSSVPAATLAGQKQAVLTQAILRASAWADEICQQVLAATLDWDQREARIRRDGWGNLFIEPVMRFSPLLAVTQIQTGYDPAKLTALTDFTGVSVVRQKVRVPVSSSLPIGTTGLAYTTPASGSRLAYGIQYVNGYANTTLTGAVAQGATSIPVANPLGIAPGQTLSLSGANGQEFVTVASTWAVPTTSAPASVPLVAGVAATTGYAAGDTLSAMPASIKEAVIMLTAMSVRLRGQHAIVVSQIRQQPDQLEQQIPGGASFYENAVDLLMNHTRTI